MCERPERVVPTRAAESAASARARVGRPLCEEARDGATGGWEGREAGRKRPERRAKLEPVQKSEAGAGTERALRGREARWEGGAEARDEGAGSESDEREEREEVERTAGCLLGRGNASRLVEAGERSVAPADSERRRKEDKEDSGNPADGER